MAKPPETGQTGTPKFGKPLDASAVEELPRLIEDLRHSLLMLANRSATGEQITSEDLGQAYKRLAFPARDELQFADAQAVISQALRENQSLERASYGMAVVLFVFGLVLLGVGVVSADTGTRIGAFVGGSVVELLILIPFRFAINSRRHNIALRMLGLILNRVSDPAKVAPLLKDTFLAVVLGKTPFKAGE